ncbi:hypothetical protein RJT34_23334 [Clitoria ternatea]|uniref:Uncharacterized protein n=1 Tax=Clitoria ternatea TaxID=43366 RepID=A0AAN9FSL1_CLITE
MFVQEVPPSISPPSSTQFAHVHVLVINDLTSISLGALLVSLCDPLATTMVWVIPYRAGSITEEYGPNPIIIIIIQHNPKQECNCFLLRHLRACPLWIDTPEIVFRIPIPFPLSLP